MFLVNSIISRWQPFREKSFGRRWLVSSIHIIVLGY